MFGSFAAAREGIERSSGMKLFPGEKLVPTPIGSGRSSALGAIGMFQPNAAPPAPICGTMSRASQAIGVEANGEEAPMGNLA